MLKVDENTDHCGPCGDHLLLRIISKCIPDKVFGVYLGECCLIHDIYMGAHGNDKAGDIDFKRNIQSKFRTADKPEWQGRLVANAYYIGVRIGGLAYKFVEWRKNKEEK